MDARIKGRAHWIRSVYVVDLQFRMQRIRSSDSDTVNQLFPVSRLKHVILFVSVSVFVVNVASRKAVA